MHSRLSGSAYLTCSTDVQCGDSGVFIHVGEPWRSLCQRGCMETHRKTSLRSSSSCYSWSEASAGDCSVQLSRSSGSSPSLASVHLCTLTTTATACEQASVPLDVSTAASAVVLNSHEAFVCDALVDVTGAKQQESPSLPSMQTAPQLSCSSESSTPLASVHLFTLMTGIVWEQKSTLLNVSTAASAVALTLHEALVCEALVDVTCVQQQASPLFSS